MTTPDDMDNELIDRLRRTLHHEAAAIRPKPRPYLSAGEANARPPRRPRPVWPVAVGVAAAAVAALVALIAANLAGSSGGPRVRVGGTIAPTSPHATRPPGSVAPTTAVHTPATQATAPPRSAPSSVPPSSAPGAAIAAVPAGFEPAAVTFVSPSDGWALGIATCSAGRCLSLARTYDAGLTWQRVAAPDAGDLAGVAAADLSVRFADAGDGWVYVTGPSSGSVSSRLWSTHDGGQTWAPVTLPVLAGGSIEELEAANHLVQMAVMSQPDGSIHIESSPAGADHWTDVPTGVPFGAGPVPSTQLVLQGASGWMVQNDRTVVGGALTTGTGRWSSWTPPCARANGSAALAASSATDLIAVCNEGVWGPPGNITAGRSSQPYPQWIFRSTNGGASFQAVKAVPTGFTANLIATSPSPATVVLAGYAASDSAALEASFDGGLTWHDVYRGPTPVQWKDLGFTTTSQGVAIASGSSGSTLLITRDGGQHWNPVSF